MEKQIVANAHTLEEVVKYAEDRYGLIEIPSIEKEYIRQRKSLKEGLILQNSPELLGEMADIPSPDVSNEKSVREYLGRLEARSEAIAEMPDNVISMDFHLYKIRIDDDFLEMDIDYIWDVFGISYSGNGKVMKQFKKIARDLYLYYGVKEDDIKNKTRRFSSLVTELSL